MSLFYIKDVRVRNHVEYKQIRIEEGKTTFLCGKSGSGKSTLLKLLNASISAECGDILYQQNPIVDYDTIALRREVTLVSQNVFLFDDTIKNNFIRFFSYREQTPPDPKKISEYLKLCIADFPLDTNCRELSGGERQRVFISICLSFMPKVLMLDEPTSALDAASSDALIHQLTSYCLENGITPIIITHDKALIKHHADAVIDLDLED